MVTKLKNSNYDKIQKLKMGQKSTFDKTPVVTKLKLWLNSNFYKTQVVTKLKLWEKNHKLKNDKTRIVTKLGNSNYDKTQKLKLKQNLKAQIWTKLELWPISIYEENLKGLLVRTFWHLHNRWDVLWEAFCDSRDVFL